MSIIGFLPAELVKPEPAPPVERPVGRIPGTGRYLAGTPAEYVEADFADEVGLLMAPWLKDGTGRRALQPGISYLSSNFVEILYTETANANGVKGVTVRQAEFTGLNRVGSAFDRISFGVRHEKYRNPATLRPMEIAISRIALMSGAEAGKKEDYIISQSVETERLGIRKGSKTQARGMTIADNTRGSNDCYYLRDFWEARPDDLNNIANGIVKAEQTFIVDLDPLPRRSDG
jgi:hypothetical protein